MLRAAPLCLLSSMALAQAPSVKPAFEVVSIKPGPPGSAMELMRSGKMGVRIDDAQAVYQAIGLQDLLSVAYQLPQDQIVAPSWLADVRFDIAAKLPAGSSRQQVPEMLQTMLAERFKMTVHHEEKVRPVYLLAVGKGPLKLRESTGGDPGQRGCNGGRGGHHTCRAVTMEELAQVLAVGRNMPDPPQGMTRVFLDRPVIDRTGLKGAYDFTMDCGPNVGSAAGRRGGAGGRGDDVPGGAPMMVPIADAVKALGLVLEPSKQPFDILVIDHIERVPTEN
jgi:uncharacterized protein (TIGR03435 family)